MSVSFIEWIMLFCFVLVALISVDLTVPDENGEPWDFSRPSMRAKAEELLDLQKPALFVGTPMCTPQPTYTAKPPAL